MGATYRGTSLPDESAIGKTTTEGSSALPGANGEALKAISAVRARRPSPRHSASAAYRLRHLPKCCGIEARGLLAHELRLVLQDRGTKDERPCAALFDFFLCDRSEYSLLEKIVNISLFCLEIAQFLFSVTVKEKVKYLMYILASATITACDLAPGEFWTTHVEAADSWRESARSYCSTPPSRSPQRPAKPLNLLFVFWP